MFRHATRFAYTFYLLSASSVFAQTADQVEPAAGTWKTWAISSGRDYRVPPPPDAASTRGEAEWVRTAIAERDPRIAQQVTYWNAAAPSYRWMDLIWNRIQSGAPVTPYPHRLFTYVSMAIYDATVAAWESKYTYNRQRPIAVDPTLRTRLVTPGSPSYPSDYAATAAAAAAVLGYFLPSE